MENAADAFVGGVSSKDQGGGGLLGGGMEGGGHWVSPSEGRLFLLPSIQLNITNVLHPKSLYSRY